MIGDWASWRDDFPRVLFHIRYSCSKVPAPLLVYSLYRHPTPGCWGARELWGFDGGRNEGGGGGGVMPRKHDVVNQTRAVRAVVQ